MKKIFLIKASILCVFLFALPCFLNAQPVACYPLDGSIGDVITGHQGGFSPGTYTVPDRFGNANGAVVTNNGTMLGGVNLGNYANLKPAQGTISVWFKITNTLHFNGTAPEYPIFTMAAQNGLHPTDGYIVVCYQASSIGVLDAVTFIGPGSIIPPLPTDTVTTRVWHHTVFTYSLTTVSLYLDNILIGSKPKNPVVFDADSYVYVGYDESYRATASAAFDDYRVYDYPMSPAEISALYNSTSTSCMSVIATDDLPLSSYISIYPNPSNGSFKVHNSSGNDIVSYTITDIIGHELVNGGLVTNEINADNLNNGIYILSLRDAKGNTSQHKIEVFK